MSDRRRHQELAELAGRVQRGERLSRRELAYWSARLGGGAALLAFLAACGGSSSTATTSAGASTAAATKAATTGAGAAGSPAPAAATTPAPVGTGEKGKVLVRTPGGAYEDAWRKAAWEPFAQETGIQIVPVATNAAKIEAMIEAGNVQLDIVDAGELPTILFQQRGALEKLDQSKFTRTSLSDVDPVHDYYTGNNVYATVLGYNKDSFKDKHPTTWAEFWDVKTFPGARMLEDMAAEMPNLEQALLADGVTPDKLYPIDIDRAFNSLGKVKKDITKFWDSGAVAAQMLADKNVVLGSVWNGRIQTLIDQGAPLAIEWNQAERILQVIAILKDAPNKENAYKYMDYVLSPEVQAKFAAAIPYGPANKKAFDHIDQKTATLLPTAPDHVQSSFQINMQWWVDNQQKVTERWQEFLLS